MAQWIGPKARLAAAMTLVAASALVTRDATADDGGVERATYQRPAESTTDRGPAAARQQSHDAAADKASAHIGRHEIPPTPSSAPALISMLGSLVFVLALFFGLIWLLRRGMPKGTRVLPAEVIEVLGRAPLAGRQQMHVVRFGSKLLLVSLTPGGAETLSEITDAAEVDRLAGICQQSQSNSATNAFRQVFRQFAEDRSFFRRSGQPSASRKNVPPTSLEDDDV